MTLHVHTSTLRYGGPDRLDITRAKGEGIGLAFAPPWDMLSPALAIRRAIEKLEKRAVETLDVGRYDELVEAVNAFSWALYDRAFRYEMRLSYRHQRAAWDELLGRERVVLVCFCPARERCHRSIVADLLVRLGAIDEGEIEP